MRKGVANLLNSVSEFMAVPPDDTNEEVITIPDDDLSPTQSHYDRKHEKLRALQTDPGTYCNEPEGKTWVKHSILPHPPPIQFSFLSAYVRYQISVR